MEPASSSGRWKKVSASSIFLHCRRAQWAPSSLTVTQFRTAGRLPVEQLLSGKLQERWDRCRASISVRSPRLLSRPAEDTSTPPALRGLPVPPTSTHSQLTAECSFFPKPSATDQQFLKSRRTWLPPKAAERDTSMDTVSARRVRLRFLPILP